MKEYILTALYEILQPWACDASNTCVYVHPSNINLTREHLKKRGFVDIKIRGCASHNFPSRFSLS